MAVSISTHRGASSTISSSPIGSAINPTLPSLPPFPPPPLPLPLSLPFQACIRQCSSYPNTNYTCAATGCSPTKNDCRRTKWKQVRKGQWEAV